MPMFEYKCKKCEAIYEELARYEDKVKCPKCGGAGEKTISTTYHPVFVHRQGKFSVRRKAAKKKAPK